MNAQHWLGVAEEIGRRFEQGVDERDEHDAFVGDHYSVLREQGLIAAQVPSELGGGGVGHATMGLMLRRLAYYDSSTALALSMHQHLLSAQVFNHLHGRPAPLLGRVVSEQIVLVSTGANDWLESNGQAIRVDGGFRVTARKSFASGAPAGAVVVTSARFDDPGEEPQVLHFGVSLSAEGVRLEDDWQVHGMRATGSQSIVFEDVFVPEQSVSLRRPRAGFAPIFNVVAVAALPLIAGVYVGIAERARDIARECASKRAEDPTVQWAMGEAVSRTVVASVCHERSLALANDLNVEPNIELTNQMFILKTQAVEEARRAVEAAMEAAGGAGFYRRTGLERLLRDVRAGHYHPLPAKKQLSFTGRLALGLDPVD